MALHGAVVWNFKAYSPPPPIIQAAPWQSVRCSWRCTDPNRPETCTAWLTAAVCALTAVQDTVQREGSRILTHQQEQQQELGLFPLESSVHSGRSHFVSPPLPCLLQPPSLPGQAPLGQCRRRQANETPSRAGSCSGGDDQESMRGIYAGWLAALPAAWRAELHSETLYGSSLREVYLGKCRISPVGLG